MLRCSCYSRFPYMQDHKWKLSEQDTHIYLLSWFLSLIATYIWNLVIRPHRSWPCVFQCFSRLTGHKGELNMNMHANLISSLCNQLKVVFNIEETMFFFWVPNDFHADLKHFCFWQIRGHKRKEGTKLWGRQFKDKVGKQSKNWIEEEKGVLLCAGKKQSRGGGLEY